MSNAYGLYQDSVTELAPTIVEGVEPGVVKTLPTIYVKRISGAEVINVYLTATLTTRSIDDGTVSDGWEVVNEKWLEAKITGGDWTPLGGGPSGGKIEIIPSDFVGGLCSVALRLNPSASPSTFGDVAFTLDLFYK